MKIPYILQAKNILEVAAAATSKSCDTAPLHLAGPRRWRARGRDLVLKSAVSSSKILFIYLMNFWTESCPSCPYLGLHDQRSLLNLDDLMLLGCMMALSLYTNESYNVILAVWILDNELPTNNYVDHISHFGHFEPSPHNSELLQLFPLIQVLTSMQNERDTAVEKSFGILQDEIDQYSVNIHRIAIK